MNKVDDIELEECVVCKCQTDVPKSLHIDYRFYYIEGCGQLCKKCYYILYKKDYEMEIYK